MGAVVQGGLGLLHVSGAVSLPCAGQFLDACGPGVVFSLRAKVTGLWQGQLTVPFGSLGLLPFGISLSW